MSASRTFASVAAADLFDTISRAASVGSLGDDIRKDLWKLWGDKQINDEDARFLQEKINALRPSSRQRATPNRTRMITRLTSRQIPRSPDRQASRDRRRTLGGSGGLPANLRHHYTEGQRAVLAIVAGECKRQGLCDLPIDQIAALAGVCRTTVQNALHEARRLGHLTITERPRRGQKSLTNLIEVSSLEWRTWLKRGSTAHRPIGSKTVKMVSPTKSTYLRNRVPTPRAVDGDGSAWLGRKANGRHRVRPQEEKCAVAAEVQGDGPSP